MVTSRPLKVARAPAVTVAPAARSSRPHASYMLNSECVALCVGAFCAALARASAGEFLTGMYVAHTCTTRRPSHTSCAVCCAACCPQQAEQAKWRVDTCHPTQEISFSYTRRSGRPLSLTIRWQGGQLWAVQTAEPG